MKNRIIKRTAFSSLAAAIFLLGGLAPSDYAGNPVVEIEGVEFSVNHGIHANLTALRGKRVMVTLDSGNEIGGRIKLVGERLLHMEKISRKDFMDAVIRIDRIIAIEAQVDSNPLLVDR